MDVPILVSMVAALIALTAMEWEAVSTTTAISGPAVVLLLVTLEEAPVDVSAELTRTVVPTTVIARRVWLRMTSLTLAPHLPLYVAPTAPAELTGMIVC